MQRWSKRQLLERPIPYSCSELWCIVSRHHYGSVPLESHPFPIQATNGHLLDELRAVPDIKSSLWRVHEEHHLLSGIDLRDVIGLMVDHDLAIASDFARIGPPMQPLQPA